MKKWMMALACVASLNVFSQTVLTPGDIAVIGFNGDDPDVIRFVNLVNIAAGTQVKFTDNGWNGTALTTAEGTDTWTSASAFAAGTVHTLTPTIRDWPRPPLSYSG